MASRAERNAAIAAAAAAQVAATCPWSGGDAVETASTASSRQPSSRSTCPWGADPEQASKPSKSSATAQRNTCPWGSDAKDMDSARLADAARRRQRPSPKNFGAAGAGAPKLPRAIHENEASQAAASLQGEILEVTQRMESEPVPSMGPLAQSNTEPAFVDEDGEDEDQREQREIIQQCLAEGLGEDQIMEILDSWQNSKLVQHTQERLQSDQHHTAIEPQPNASSLQASAQSQAPFGAPGASLAASRQAKAVKSLSFGPSDEEIVDVLKDYSKENLTPPESPPNATTLAARRKKEKEVSEASVGGFDSDKSRAAYLQSKSQMDAVKNKNRISSGIF